MPRDGNELASDLIADRFGFAAAAYTFASNLVLFGIFLGRGGQNAQLNLVGCTIIAAAAAYVMEKKHTKLFQQRSDRKSALLSDHQPGSM